MNRQQAIDYLSPHEATNDRASIMLNAGKVRQALDVILNGEQCPFDDLNDVEQPAKDEPCPVCGQLGTTPFNLTLCVDRRI